MTIISLSGRKQSGKSTVAELIQEILKGYDSDLDVRIIAWADALKREVAKACNVSIEYLEEHKPNFRLILQGWGTDFRRELCTKCYWTDQLLIELAKNTPSDCIVVIPDTRFLDELEVIQQIGGYTWLVKKDKALVDNGLVSLPLPEDTHSSETEHLKFKYDTEIENYYDKGYLKQCVRSKLEQLGIIKL